MLLLLLLLLLLLAKAVVLGDMPLPLDPTFWTGRTCYDCDPLL